MKRISIILISIIISITSFALPERPVPAKLVNDLAGILSSRQINELEKVLVAFDDSTSNQIAVVTVKDLEGYSPAEYATKLGLKWQVGSEKFDNGVVLLIKPKTTFSKGEVNISVGYGLEGAIPDAYAKRIIEQVMIPHLRQNNYYSAIANACLNIMKLASGEISEAKEKKEDSSGIMPSAIAFLILILFLRVLFKGGNNNGGKGGRGKYRSTSSSADTLMDAILIGSLLNGGRNSGGFGGGGSFGGGGFGGGGFGGFGGGSFGGGGASGSW